MSDEVKPQFSRNLELNEGHSEPGSPQRADAVGTGAPPAPEEKGMYFRVEGQKILEMLTSELGRAEPDPASVILLKDLHRSWRTLWRGDDSFPVGTFTDMFELVFSVLSSIVVLGRRTSPEERRLLDELQDNMSRLVGGNPNIGNLEACRRLIEKAARVAGKLKEESMGWHDKSVQAKEEVRAVEEPRPGVRRAAPATGKPDITSSVDEWFEQVTRLMVQPQPQKQTTGAGAEGQKKPSPVNHARSLSRPGAERFTGAGRGPVDEAPSTDQIVLFPGEKNADRVEIKPAPAPVASRPEKPAVISVRKIPDRQPTPKVPEPEAVKKAVAPAAILNPATPPPEVLAYFRELSTVTLEVLDKNLPEITESSSGRGLRLVVSYLDKLQEVAQDFGLEGRLSSLEKLRESLSQVPDNRSRTVGAALRQRLDELARQLRGNLN